MVRIPEALVVFAARLFHRSEYHGHQGYQHHVACGTGAGAEVGEQEAFDACLRGDGETRKVDPVGDGVDPGEEDDGPGGEFVEGDVFVKVDDAVQRGFT
jgi:hypothetical protein